MADIIQFPKDRIKRNVAAFIAEVEEYRERIEDLEKKGFGGLFLLECGPYVEGGARNISKVAISGFICNFLEDPQISYLVNQMLKERAASRNKED
jgi:hypothetical protein